MPGWILSVGGVAPLSGWQPALSDQRTWARRKALDLDSTSMALLANPQVDVFGHPGAITSAFFGPYTGKGCGVGHGCGALTEGRRAEFGPRYGMFFPLSWKMP